jgi:hypothetical protein
MVSMGDPYIYPLIDFSCWERVSLHMHAVNLESSGKNVQYTNLLSFISTNSTYTLWYCQLLASKNTLPCINVRLFPPQGLKLVNTYFYIFSFHFLCSGCYHYTDMRHLTTVIRSEKCVIRWFHCCTNVCKHKPRQYSIAYCTPWLYCVAYGS